MQAVLQGQKHNGTAWWRALPIQLLAGAKRSGQLETNIHSAACCGIAALVRGPKSDPSGISAPLTITPNGVEGEKASDIHDVMRHDSQNDTSSPSVQSSPYCICPRSVGLPALHLAIRQLPGLDIESVSAEPHHGPSPLWKRGQDGTDTGSLMWKTEAVLLRMGHVRTKNRKTDSPSLQGRTRRLLFRSVFIRQQTDKGSGVAQLGC